MCRRGSLIKINPSDAYEMIKCMNIASKKL